jgi:cell wall-associated NlpC family hydrolase
MKNLKIATTICFASLLMLCNSNIALATTGVVNTPAARIREKASSDSEILTKAYEDEEVEILGEDGDWYKVKVNGQTGYVSKSLIDKKSESSKNTNTVSTYKTDDVSNTTSNTTTSNSTTSNDTTSSSKAVISEDVVGKILPNFASNEVMLLAKDEEVEILRELNNWVEVSANGREVWILKSKINSDDTETTSEVSEKENTVEENNTIAENTVTNTTANTATNTTTNTTTNTSTSNTTSTTEVRNQKGIVNVETANVREKADKSSSIIARLDEDDEVTILSEEGDWYKIQSSKVESGYVSKSLITVSNVSSRSSQEEREETQTTENATTKGSEVASFAKQYLGYSYVLGGKTPETGFDCSGFTRYVFKNFGYSLGTVASDQNSLGTEIARSDLQEGDLILFYNEEKTKIGHTGIYIGNDEFIHAANPDRGVVIDNLSTSSYYSSRFVNARRIVE